MMLHPITIHNLQIKSSQVEKATKKSQFCTFKMAGPRLANCFSKMDLMAVKGDVFFRIFYMATPLSFQQESTGGWLQHLEPMTCQIHWLPWMEIHCLHCVVALDGADHHLSSQSAIWNRYMVSNWRVPIAWIIIWRKRIAMCTASSHFHANHSRLCNTFWHSCRLLRSLHRKMFNHPKFNMFHSAYECH